MDEQEEIQKGGFWITETRVDFANHDFYKEVNHPRSSKIELKKAKVTLARKDKEPKGKGDEYDRKVRSITIQKWVKKYNELGGMYILSRNKSRDNI